MNEIGEDYECVFMQLTDIQVVAQNEFQEYIAVSEAGDTVIIDNYIYQPSLEIGAFYNINGTIDFQYGSFRILPRDAEE
ncbi:MAG: hypothetical protein IPF54_14505 [Draconibacterium sp.]|nr:hypothetical protein [Draconibacterium sp.]